MRMTRDNCKSNNNNIFWVGYYMQKSKQQSCGAMAKTNNLVVSSIGYLQNAAAVCTRAEAARQLAQP
jgi:hypothetical protein